MVLRYQAGLIGAMAGLVLLLTEGANTVVAASFNWVTGAPEPQAYERLMADNPEARQMQEWMSVITTGLAVYYQFERSIPGDLKALCASPYLAVRCKDMANPWGTGSIADASPGTPGWISYEVVSGTGSPGTAKLVLLRPRIELRVKDDEGNTHTVETHWKYHYAPGAATIAPESVSDWSPEERSAYAVATFVRGRISRYERETGKLPATYDDLAKRYPLVVNLLRNDFTGAVSKAVSSPIPGNLSWQVRKDENGKIKSIVVLTYGQNGRILEELLKYDRARAPE